MPKINKNDYELYFEEHGSGIPILFLEGLGYSLWMWKYQLSDVKKWARAILVDNRGVGKSSPLSAPYSVTSFAEDALNIMDHLNIEKFYVLGVSMGGFIAQELARISPERVKGLILVSTSCGGPKSYSMTKEVFDEMMKTVDNETQKEKLKRTMKLAFTNSYPDLNKEIFEDIINERILTLQDQKQLLFQSLSLLNFDSCTSNSELNMPSIIIAGTEDKVLPWLNSILLYKSLKNSSLILFKGQNHLLFIEKYKEFNDLIKNFVLSVEEGSFKEYIMEVK
ncbi:MAG: alpha/beta hydrolase [Thermoplasmata archaeon]